MPARAKKVYVSRFFDSNCEQVAGMCSKCYNEREAADKKSKAQNRRKRKTMNKLIEENELQFNTFNEEETVKVEAEKSNDHSGFCKKEDDETTKKKRKKTHSATNRCNTKASITCKTIAADANGVRNNNKIINEERITNSGRVKGITKVVGNNKEIEDTQNMNKESITNGRRRSLRNNESDTLMALPESIGNKEGIEYGKKIKEEIMIHGRRRSLRNGEGETIIVVVEEDNNKEGYEDKKQMINEKRLMHGRRRSLRNSENERNKMLYDGDEETDIKKGEIDNKNVKNQRRKINLYNEGCRVTNEETAEKNIKYDEKSGNKTSVRNSSKKVNVETSTNDKNINVRNTTEETTKCLNNNKEIYSKKTNNERKTCKQNIRKYKQASCDGKVSKHKADGLQIERKAKPNDEQVPNGVDNNEENCSKHSLIQENIISENFILVKNAETNETLKSPERSFQSIERRNIKIEETSFHVNLCVTSYRNEDCPQETQLLKTEIEETITKDLVIPQETNIFAIKNEVSLTKNHSCAFNINEATSQVIKESEASANKIQETVTKNIVKNINHCLGLDVHEETLQNTEEADIFTTKIYKTNSHAPTISENTLNSIDVFPIKNEENISKNYCRVLNLNEENPYSVEETENDEINIIIGEAHYQSCKEPEVKIEESNEELNFLGFNLNRIDELTFEHFFRMNRKFEESYSEDCYRSLKTETKEMILIEEISGFKGFQCEQDIMIDFSKESIAAIKIVTTDDECLNEKYLDPEICATYHEEHNDNKQELIAKLNASTFNINETDLKTTKTSIEHIVDFEGTCNVDTEENNNESIEESINEEDNNENIKIKINEVIKAQITVHIEENNNRNIEKSSNEDIEANTNEEIKASIIEHTEENNNEDIEQDTNEDFKTNITEETTNDHGGIRESTTTHTSHIIDETNLNKISSNNNNMNICFQQNEETVNSTSAFPVNKFNSNYEENLHSKQKSNSKLCNHKLKAKESYNVNTWKTKAAVKFYEQLKPIKPEDFEVCDFKGFRDIEEDIECLKKFAESLKNTEDVYNSENTIVDLIRTQNDFEEHDFKGFNNIEEDIKAFHDIETDFHKFEERFNRIKEQHNFEATSSQKSKFFNSKPKKQHITEDSDYFNETLKRNDTNNHSLLLPKNEPSDLPFASNKPNLLLPKLELPEANNLLLPKLEPADLPPGAYKPLWSPPKSPHNLIEESLYKNPWGLLVATIFLNKTTCYLARPCIEEFLDHHPTPQSVLSTKPHHLEKYFEKIGLKKRAHQVWRMSHDFLYKKWRRAGELHGIGKYGEDAFEMFCRGNMEVEPNDRFLKIYKAWNLMMKQQGRSQLDDLVCRKILT